MLTLFKYILLLIVAFAPAIHAHQQNIQHITIVNQSEVTLMPTAEGLTGGCMGGSLPPLFKPITPHETRNVPIIFVNYFPSCRFDVLPQPTILTYLQACHQVKANDTVTFTGSQLAKVRCEILPGGHG